MVKDEEVVALLPQRSLAVKVTVTVCGKLFGSPAKLWLQFTVLHVSTAVAPPWLLSQAARAATFPTPSLSTITGDAAVVMIGGLTSCTLRLAVVTAEFPEASSAVKVIEAELQTPGRVVKLFVHVTAPSLSVAVAPPFEAS